MCYSIIHCVVFVSFVLNSEFLFSMQLTLILMYLLQPLKTSLLLTSYEHSHHSFDYKTYYRNVCLGPNHMHQSKQEHMFIFTCVNPYMVLWHVVVECFNTLAL